MTAYPPAPPPQPQPVQPQVINVQSPAQPGLPPLPQRELGVAYALMLFTFIGVAGIQHFYLGKIGRGVLWLLTFGLLGIGTIVDLFTLPSQTRTVNARRVAG